MLKDATEIRLLRQAIALTDRAFAEVVPALQVGMTEREAALEVERQLRLAGADALSFPVIAAFGPNSADPHAEPSARKLKATDNVKLDFGGQAKGYHADLTRTVFLREPTRKQARIHELVLEAQQRAIAACRPGIPAKDVDTVAREFLKDAGFGDAFTHGLGHGVGLEVHEGPGLAQTSTDVLAPRMVVTVEPGIYLKGWGGVRIEDVVLITERGHQVMTRAPK
jgi:Xaa-Pro aminopeptidase